MARCDEEEKRSPWGDHKFRAWKEIWWSGDKGNAYSEVISLFFSFSHLNIASCKPLNHLIHIMYFEDATDDNVTGLRCNIEVPYHLYGEFNPERIGCCSKDAWNKLKSFPSKLIS